MYALQTTAQQLCDRLRCMCVSVLDIVTYRNAWLTFCSSGGGEKDPMSTLPVRGIQVKLPSGRNSSDTDYDQVLKMAVKPSFKPAREDDETREKLLDEESTGDAPKQTRLQTIASLVNTMMGTTIVSLPFGMSEAGIGSGLLIIFVLGACSCYTALILARAGGPGEEFSAVVARYLGKRVQVVAWATSLAIIVGAAVVYHILMQETLYALVQTIAESILKNGDGLSSTVWRREYAALIPWILYPVSNLKDMSALVKFNSLGFIFLWYTILFMLSHGFSALGQGSTVLETAVLPPPDGSFYSQEGKLRVVLGGSSSFAGLGGMMMLSFFLHNCFQPIVKNADPKTVHVDMGIAYSIAGLLYSAVGIFGYFGMADAKTAAECVWGAGTSNPGSTPCTPSSNFLAMFGTSLGDSWGIYALSARMSLLLQLFTVFPLLLLIIRAQVWGFVCGTSWPGFTRVAGLNFVIMACTFAAAAVDAKVSEVLRFVGAIGGLIIVYAVPLAVHAAQRRLGSAHKPTAVSMEDEVLAGLLGAGDEAEDGGRKGEGGEVGLVVPLKPSWVRAGLDTFVMAVGTLFFVLQFVPQLSGS